MSIGLSKNTKLSAVFDRFVDFCNEAVKSMDRKITTTDLEFVHSQLLSGSDTAEASALMKNDRITVRKVRTAEREAEADRKRLQRESDRNFFQQIREMGGSRTADIIFDCQGKLVDESGRNQRVLSSTVKAHSAVLVKRCPWLGGIIQTARAEAVREEALLEPRTSYLEEELKDTNTNIVQRVESDAKSGDEEEDDDMAVLSFSPKNGEENKAADGVAEIENDEDEEGSFDDLHPFNAQEIPRSDSPAIVPSDKPAVQAKKLLRVTIRDHSPEAVKLLLEYCYSNRVFALGQEAFVQACKTKPQKHAGPIAPFPISSSGSRKWPKNGFPTLSLSVALAGISLAEEAGIPRLSLMCEVAASQLLSSTNVVKALTLCSSQKGKTGNDLPRLRKAAIELVLRSGPRGISELGRSQLFRRALDDQRAMIVPTLLQGTMEAVTAHEKTRSLKRDRHEMSRFTFEELDSEDKYCRDRERKKRKLERMENDPSRRHDAGSMDMEDLYDEFKGWAAESSKRSLKRMAKHLESMTSRSMAVFSSSSSRSRFSFGTTSGGSRRSSGNRRRSTSNQP